MQRVKDSDKCAKFDMIRGTSWVRGVSRIILSHSLTMNMPRDLLKRFLILLSEVMPEDKKRVEFHYLYQNIPIISWMQCQLLKILLIQQQLLGDIQQLPLLTMLMFRFPHGYHRAKKAGIKAIFGLEANLVEDKKFYCFIIPRICDKSSYVVFDVETTGLSAVHNDLIQIAASNAHKVILLSNLMNS